MKFQDKLQILRKQRTLSQEKLAENLGVSRQAVAKWEAGLSYPELDKIIILSDLFKISIDRLVRDNDSNCSYECDGQHQFINDDLIDFLCRAKKASYAGNGAEMEPSRPNSHDLHYIENNLKYIDTYIGGKNFAGEEAVWCDDLPFWSMNYAGRIIADGFSGAFLKECLLLVPREYPFRGPMVHVNGDYTYHCIVEGEFEWFKGYEDIFCNGTKVYECMFHGGCIK